MAAAPASHGAVMGQGRFRLLSLLGRGAFGDVYRGIATAHPHPDPDTGYSDTAAGPAPINGAAPTSDGDRGASADGAHTRSGGGFSCDPYAGVATDRRVAVKLEPLCCRHPQLQYEASLYELFQGCEHIPACLWHGVDGGFRMLVLPLLEENLLSFVETHGDPISPATASAFGRQMLSAVAFVHGRGFVHRDVKPENLVISRSTGDARLCLIDFGLARRYRDLQDEQGHVANASERQLIGNARFASINAHLGHEQSRRDDVESLVYVLVYTLRRRFPWDRLQAGSINRLEQVMQHKMSCSMEALCGPFVGCLAPLVTYPRRLRYEEAPNYRHLDQLLVAVAAHPPAAGRRTSSRVGRAGAGRRVGSARPR